jgi:basic membrane lipoprotein Med (substrate-binding protein (PBP1-ABC) superfamily)
MPFLSLEVHHHMKLTRSAVAALIAVTGALVAAPMANSQEQKSVALMFDLTGRGDKSFNDAAAAGLDKAKAEFPTLKATESVPSGADGDRAERLKTVLADKNGLVICVGFLWSPDCAKGAAANPDVAFASIDDELAIDGKPLANSAGYKFAEQEGSYLVGYIAGLKTKTGKVGFIGGVEIDLIKKFEAGFEAGAKAANKKVKITQKYASYQRARPSPQPCTRAASTLSTLLLVQPVTAHSSLLKNRAKSLVRSGPSASTPTSTTPSRQQTVVTTSSRRCSRRLT